MGELASSGSVPEASHARSKPVIVNSAVDAEALAAAERWKVATAMNLPVCVRAYGAPDVIDINNHGCGSVIYPDAGWRFEGDWNYPSRATFVYRARGEKVVMECGSITARLPLSESDVRELDRVALARGGTP